MVVEFLQTLFYVFIEPLLCHLHLLTPGFGDPTYGREHVPYTETERKLIYENPQVTAIRRKVLLPADDLLNSGSWDQVKSSWVTYYVWTMQDREQDCGLDSDIVMVHGINDYAGKLAPHAFHFMQKGFRIIAIDLPSFGRSTGLHGHVPSMRINVSAMHAAILDVRQWDIESGRSVANRKLFAEGHSMGAFTVLYYAALYSADHPNGAVVNGVLPPPSPSPPIYRPKLSGIAVAAPLIIISPESRPSKFIEYVAKTLRFFAARLPIAKAIKGNVSDDPRVEIEFENDPLTYKGLLRISTGLAVLDGIQHLEQLAPNISCPLVIHHGANDRATNPQGSKDFIQLVGTKPSDKMVKIWEGYEHVMMKNVKGMSKQDEQKRDAILFEIADWLVTQAKNLDLSNSRLSVILFSPHQHTHSNKNR